MVAKTVIDSNASNATLYTSQYESWERRMMRPGKMIASAWTKVVDALKEGRNQREPVPPRHSHVISYSPLVPLLSNGMFWGSTSH
jgi:hypothetical protein